MVVDEEPSKPARLFRSGCRGRTGKTQSLLPKKGRLSSEKVDTLPQGKTFAGLLCNRARAKRKLTKNKKQKQQKERSRKKATSSIRPARGSPIEKTYLKLHGKGQTTLMYKISLTFSYKTTFERELVSRLYPTPLPRPISIQYSVTRRPTSSLSPCDTTIHLFALGPISVFVSRYTWYECAAGREKQSQNLIEKTYSWTCCTTAMTCQGPRIHLSGPATWKWVLPGTTLKKKKKKKERAWQKERNKRWKWERTENAQVDKENNWALLHGHFLKSIAMWKAQL